MLSDTQINIIQNTSITSIVFFSSIFYTTGAMVALDLKLLDKSNTPIQILSYTTFAFFIISCMFCFIAVNFNTHEIEQINQHNAEDWDFFYPDPADITDFVPENAQNILQNSIIK